MLKMSQINHIRDLWQCGYSITEIAKQTGYDRATVSKYLKTEDFSPEPVKQARVVPSKLDPYKEIIRKWIRDDQKEWYKQRHTAKRIYDRLVSEYSFDGSYDIVRRFVKGVKEELKAGAQSFNELVWEAGCAQADFGEADFIENGDKIRKKYLVLSFPYSNDGFVQIFGGETAECVSQGLQSIFEYIGGVPPLIVFDNATGVGRKIGDEIRESVFFSRFRAHYRFRIRFCNPDSGHEKGNVERKVGYDRSNLFVPIPRFDNILDYNNMLLDAHKVKATEIHYKRGIRISELFEEDRQALLTLPAKRFDVCHYVYPKADGYGKVCVDGKHYYSTKPEWRKQTVTVGLRAHTVDILDENGNVVITHRRDYSKKRTDSVDYSTSISVLLRNCGAWENSGIRRDVPDVLREYMDRQPRPQLKECLRILDTLTDRFGYAAAIKAMNMSAENGNVNMSDSFILCQRITGYGIETPPSEGPSLEIYDQAFLKGGMLS